MSLPSSRCSDLSSHHAGHTDFTNHASHANCSFFTRFPIHGFWTTVYSFKLVDLLEPKKNTAAPKWVLKPSPEYSVLQGRNLLIDCQTQGYPVPIHQWKKFKRTQSVNLVNPHGASIALSSSSASKEFVSIVSGPHVHVLENGSLVIIDADKSDEGEYLCGSSNIVGSIISSPVYVKVNTAAHFKKNFASLKSKINDKVAMLCEAFGDEPIRLSWSKEHEILSNTYSQGKKYIIQENARSHDHVDGDGGLVDQVAPVRSSRLSIESLDLTDSGFYICTASNQYGREEMSFQLLVQGVPEAPKDVKATDVSSRKATITWKEPPNGNSAIIEYSLNYRKNDGEWWPFD